MLPFLQVHALAATRGDGLRPELRVLFERQVEALQAAADVDVAVTDDRHLMELLAWHKAPALPDCSSAGALVCIDAKR